VRAGSGKAVLKKAKERKEEDVVGGEGGNANLVDQSSLFPLQNPMQPSLPAWRTKWLPGEPG